MIAIRDEVRAIERGALGRDDNPLKHAPHTAQMIGADEWPHAYARSQAAWPVATLASDKYWCPVARVDNVYGDRNLFCSCVPVAETEAGSNGDFEETKPSGVRHRFRAAVAGGGT